MLKNLHLYHFIKKTAIFAAISLLRGMRNLIIGTRLDSVFLISVNSIIKGGTRKEKTIKKERKHNDFAPFNFRKFYNRIRLNLTRKRY